MGKLVEEFNKKAREFRQKNKCIYNKKGICKHKEQIPLGMTIIDDDCLSCPLYEGKKKKNEKKKPKKRKIYKSFHENDKKCYEQVMRNKMQTYCAWDTKGNIEYIDEIHSGKDIIVPINDDAIDMGAILLPNEPISYKNEDELIKDIAIHIKQYCDIPDDFILFSSYYVLLTWVYDKLNTLPYLRAMGDTGSGKSRFIDVVGRLCYKPCIVSGSINPAPIYRMIKAWGGTLLIDESDFKQSDEKNEVITILNCGFERNRPVIRCDKNDPNKLQFFPTYCPKVFGTRSVFEDKALESRCLTHIMIETDRNDIPAILPPHFYEREKELRNQLLMFRIRNRHKINANNIYKVEFKNIEPRLKQAVSSFAVLFYNIPEVKDKFDLFIEKYNIDLIEERADSDRGMVVNIYFDLFVDDYHEIDKISSQDIYERAKLSLGNEISAIKIGKFMKELGFISKQRKIEGKIKRCFNLDYLILSKTHARYSRDAERWQNIKDKLKQFLGKGIGCIKVYRCPPNFLKKDKADEKSQSRTPVTNDTLANPIPSEVVK
jgi:hypothetical protein